MVANFELIKVLTKYLYCIANRSHPNLFEYYQNSVNMNFLTRFSLKKIFYVYKKIGFVLFFINSGNPNSNDNFCIVLILIAAYTFIWYLLIFCTDLFNIMIHVIFYDEICFLHFQYLLFIPNTFYLSNNLISDNDMIF